MEANEDNVFSSGPLIKQVPAYSLPVGCSCRGRLDARVIAAAEHYPSGRMGAVALAVVSGFSNEEVARFLDALIAPVALVHTYGTPAFHVFFGLRSRDCQEFGGTSPQLVTGRGRSTAPGSLRRLSWRARLPLRTDIQVHQRFAPAS
jgi:hypothetical protein